MTGANPCSAATFPRLSPRTLHRLQTQARRVPPTPVGPPIFTPMEQALGGALAGMVQPAIRKGTRLIDIYVKHHDPALAQRLANAVGREYIRYDIQHRSISTEETLRYLMGEEERLRNNLQRNGAALLANQAGLATALRSSGATGIGTQTQPSASGGATPANPDDLSSMIASLKAERMRLEMEQKQIERVADNVQGLLAIPGIAAAPEVSARRAGSCPGRDECGRPGAEI